MALELEKAIILNSRTNENEMRYIITEDAIPLDEINSWLDDVSTTSPLTGQRYAYVLMDFLRYLHMIRKQYRDVTNQKTIKAYIKHLLGYSGEVVSTHGQKSLKTIRMHVSVLKQFYNWLQENGITEHDPVGYGHQKNNKNKTYVKTKFLYGQIYNFNNEKTNPFYTKLRFSKKQEHVKWYTIEQIQNIMDNLPHHKDRIIFRISVECGLRISEILGLHLVDMDRFEKIIKVVRRANIENESYAKRKDRNVEILNDIPIYADDLMKDIEDYINGEREQVDEYRSTFLFLNVKGTYKGKPVKRRNYLKILKNTAKKIGLDPKFIRTHSGRSTRIDDLLEKKVPIAVVSDYVGASPNTIHKYYRNRENQNIKNETLKKLTPRSIKTREEREE